MTDHPVPVPLPVPTEQDLADATATPTLAEMRAALTAAVAPMREVLARVMDDATAAANDPETLAYILRGARMLRERFIKPLLDDLAIVDREVEDLLAPVIPRGGLPMLGIGVVNRRAAYRAESWHGEMLLTDLSRPLVDPESGEVVKALPLDVAKDLLPQASSTSAKWKTTHMAKHGIDPDNYRTRTLARFTVTIDPVAIPTTEDTE